MFSVVSAFAIQLVDRCDIVERGERLQTWFVRHNSAWVHAHRHPNAKAREECDTIDRLPPGTVWLRSTELALPRGTVLKQVTTWPRPVNAEDAVDYLRREVRGMYRHQLDRYYRVSGTYCLQLAPEINARRQQDVARPPHSQRAIKAAAENAALERRRQALRIRLEEWVARSAPPAPSTMLPRGHSRLLRESLQQLPGGRGAGRLNAHGE